MFWLMMVYQQIKFTNKKQNKNKKTHMSSEEIIALI